MAAESILSAKGELRDFGQRETSEKFRQTHKFNASLNFLLLLKYGQVAKNYDSLHCRLTTPYKQVDSLEKKALPGFEPGLRESKKSSKSRVIATTL